MLTLFEYLSVAVSIVLSLSAAQILVNLRAVFDPARRYIGRNRFDLNGQPKATEDLGITD